MSKEESKNKKTRSFVCKVCLGTFTHAGARGRLPLLCPACKDLARVGKRARVGPHDNPGVTKSESPAVNVAPPPKGPEVPEPTLEEKLEVAWQALAAAKRRKGVPTSEISGLRYEYTLLCGLLTGK